MDTRNNAIDAAKADFYLCLARALMAPIEAPHAEGILGGDLSDDLADLDRDIGYGLKQATDALQRDLNAINGHEHLLVLYSQLFLAPPRKVQLNAATYLDGSFNGGTVMELEQCYAAHGVVRADAFHDLADHVSVQLEFIAHLYRTRAAGKSVTGSTMAPGQFIARYPLRWIFPLVDDVRRVGPELEIAANPFLRLLEILEAALDSDAEIADDSLTPGRRRERALAAARQRRAERKVSAEEMEGIRRRLEAQGLSTAHLDPDQNNNPFAGWEAMVPPSPKR